MSAIARQRTVGFQFPAAITLGGPDALNAEPDYSAGCLNLEADVSGVAEAQLVTVEAVIAHRDGLDPEVLFSYRGRPRNR